MSGYTDEQQSAIDLVALRPTAEPWAAPGIACLTGGPGTGKTHTIKGIVHALQACCETFALCAPSGKAALRMAEATGHETSTIHMLLKIRPGSDKPADPVEADVLIVDESSMIDVLLMAQVIAAAQAGSTRTILLVGDADQLPPVGAGRPFHDLVESGVCETVRLTVVKRQGEGSGIALAAASIRCGEVPTFNETDFEFVEVENSGDIPLGVLQELQRRGWDPRSSQVLAPQHPGPCGVFALCEILESEAHRALPEVVVEKKNKSGRVDRLRFRLGTKAMATKNDYKRQVMNGEIGWVVECERGEKLAGSSLQVEFAGKVHEYRGADIRKLVPAWAITCHKSQGSEWPSVIVVAHPAHTIMLTRSLLYVAITRASERCVVVGTRVAIDRAVRKVRDVKRNTELGRLYAGQRAKAGVA